MRRMDVDKKIDEFKREYNLNVDFDAMGNLDADTVCAGVVQFIEDEQNYNDDDWYREEYKDKGII